MKRVFSLEEMKEKLDSETALQQDGEWFRIPCYRDDLIGVTELVPRSWPVRADGETLIRFFHYDDVAGVIPRELGIDPERYAGLDNTAVFFCQYRDDCINDPSIRYGEAELRFTGPVEATHVIFSLPRAIQVGDTIQVFPGYTHEEAKAMQRLGVERLAKREPDWLKGATDGAKVALPDDGEAAEGKNAEPLDTWIFYLNGRLHQLRLLIADALRREEEAEEAARELFLKQQEELHRYECTETTFTI